MVLSMIFQFYIFVGTVKYEKNVKHFYSSTEKAFLWSMWYTAHNVVVDKILPLDLKASGAFTLTKAWEKPRFVDITFLHVFAVT